MTDITKNTRRRDWRSLNFAGTVDWAVDLQTFTADDYDVPKRPLNGQGCVEGQDDAQDTLGLCEFACKYGFCPEPLCYCTQVGQMIPLPKTTRENVDDIGAADEFNLEYNRLCRFACQYGICPQDACIDKGEGKEKSEVQPPAPIPTEYYNRREETEDLRCQIFKDTRHAHITYKRCEHACRHVIAKAKEDGQEWSNWGCVGAFPLNEPIPWKRDECVDADYAVGECNCNNWLANEIMTTVIEAMPVIAQVRMLSISDFSTVDFPLYIASQFTW